MTDDELIAMARAARVDDRLSDGALYGRLADRIRALIAERDEARSFLDSAVTSSPEPLRELGKYLADKFDEDEWADVEPYLNRAALDAAMESRAGGVWQPIETAPHGVEVLLATPPFASMGEQARWEIKVGRASWGECIGGISNVSHDGWATHWMPLTTHPDTTLEDRT